MLLNRANLDALFTGFNTAFKTAFAGVANATDWQRVAMDVPSTTSQNQYGWLGSNFSIREWIGDRQIQNLETHDFTIKNRPFEGTVGVNRDDIEDDTYGVYGPLISLMGEGAAAHPNLLVFELLRKGESQSCFDGQYFFDTDHAGYAEDGSAVSVSNHMGGTGTPWFVLCTKRAVKPVVFQRRRAYTFTRMDADTDEVVFSRKQIRYGVDARVNAGYGLWQMAVISRQPLTADTFAAARAAMIGIRKPDGQPAGFVPDTLLVPATLEGSGRKVVMSDTKPNGESNEWRGSAELMMSPWL